MENKDKLNQKSIPSLLVKHKFCHRMNHSLSQLLLLHIVAMNIAVVTTIWTRSAFRIVSPHRMPSPSVTLPCNITINTYIAVKVTPFLSSHRCVALMKWGSNNVHTVDTGWFVLIHESHSDFPNMMFFK